VTGRVALGNAARILEGDERAAAKVSIVKHHYTHSVPSGKSHYVGYGPAIVVWSIPANYNTAKFLMDGGTVWELSRLWAPDGHADNLLTQAIAAAVAVIKRLEKPDALVSYADPNVGHSGGVYKAASWMFHGQSEESRAYRGPNGEIVSRRAFHSGKRSMRKAEIEALGYTQLRLPGKLRFVRPLSKRSRRLIQIKLKGGA
jgi:hypothetical protein